MLLLAHLVLFYMVDLVLLLALLSLRLRFILLFIRFIRLLFIATRIFTDWRKVWAYFDDLFVLGSSRLFLFFPQLKGFIV